MTTTTNPLTGLPVGVDLHEVLRLAARLESFGAPADKAYAAAVERLTPKPGRPAPPPHIALQIEERDYELILRRGKKDCIRLNAHDLERVIACARRLLRLRRSHRRHQDVRTWERRYDR